MPQPRQIRRSYTRVMSTLMIVIGIVKVLQYTAPTEGHIPRGYVMQAPPMVTPPPPVPPAGSYTDNDPNANRESGHV